MTLATPPRANSQYPADLTHSSLMSFEANGGLANSLAESHQWLSPTKLLVTVRSGIKFSDGSVERSEDVIAAYKFFSRKDLKTPSGRSIAFKNLRSIAKKRMRQILFKLKQPDASFATNLGVGILSKKSKVPNLIQNPFNLVNCGTYKISEATSQQIILRKSSLYNLTTTPKTEQIRIKIVNDEQTKLAKLGKRRARSRPKWRSTEIE
jgi:peptide/nickel transport system substrate-binding protein